MRREEPPKEEFELTLTLHPEEHHGVGSMPSSLIDAAKLLRAAKLTELDDIAKALEQFVCGVCNGTKSVGHRKTITCPQCAGTGWANAAEMFPDDEEVDNADISDQ
jgi:hypothetical protein